VKIFLYIILLFFYNGCNLEEKFYVLSTSSSPSLHYKKMNKSIGVEKVIIPHYLFKREIAVAKSSSEIYFLQRATWAENLDEGLTNRLISFLQKKFNNPNVYHYPWGVDTQPDIKIKLQITRFIAENNKIYLNATWRVVNLHTQRVNAKLFSQQIKTSEESSKIVSSMDSIFRRLEEKIALSVKNSL